MTFLGVSSETWFPVITLIVGAILKGVFDLLAEQRADRRARSTREEQRRDAIGLKRLEFQQATLLEFQESVGRLVRLIGRAHYQDEMNYRETREWHRSRLTEDVDQGILTNKRFSRDCVSVFEMESPESLQRAYGTLQSLPWWPRAERRQLHR